MRLDNQISLKSSLLTLLAGSALDLNIGKSKVQSTGEGTSQTSQNPGANREPTTFVEEQVG